KGQFAADPDLVRQWLVLATGDRPAAPPSFLLPAELPLNRGKGFLIDVLLGSRDQHQIILRAGVPVASPYGKGGAVGGHGPEPWPRDVVEPRNLAFGDAIGE